MFQFLLALLAGLVTIGGPCILPLLPIVLGTGTTSRHPLRPVAIVLGFTVTFTAFAVIFSLFGSFLGLKPDTWRYLSAVIIGLFGLMMVFPKIQTSLFGKLEPLLAKLTPRGTAARSDLISGFILGLSLGAIWTPCAGPILGSILTLIAAKQQLAQAGALLFAFALGAGIPMLLIAYGGQYAVKHVRAFSKYTAIIQRVFGGLIILVAIALITKTDVALQAYLLNQCPYLFFGLKFNI